MRTANSSGGRQSAAVEVTAARAHAPANTTTSPAMSHVDRLDTEPPGVSLRAARGRVERRYLPAVSLPDPLAQALLAATGRDARDAVRVGGGDINEAWRVELDDHTRAFVKTRPDAP